MKPSGWIFMGLYWSFIIGLAVFCFTKVLKKGGGAGIQADLEVAIALGFSFGISSAAWASSLIRPAAHK